MSRETVRVAQIGVGGMGRAHLQAIRAHPRAQLVAVCDVSAEALDAACTGEPILRFHEIGALFESAEFDALVVVLPHDLYPPVIALAAARGIAVLKEKPFARNLTDAQKLHQAVTSAGSKFLCAAQRQYGAPFLAAQEMIQAGELGDIFLCQGSIFYPWRDDPRTWAWRGERQRSGGIAILDSGWHVLDGMVWLKGLPSSVYARVGQMRAVSGDYDIDDKAILAFDYPDGAIGSLTACFLTVPSRYELRLHGTLATLELTQEQLTLTSRSGDEPRVVEADGRDVIAAQFDHFLEVVLDGIPPRVGIDEALHLQRVVEAAYESAVTDRRVDLLW